MCNGGGGEALTRAYREKNPISLYANGQSSPLSTILKKFGDYGPAALSSDLALNSRDQKQIHLITDSTLIESILIGYSILHSTHSINRRIPVNSTSPLIMQVRLGLCDTRKSI